MSAIYTIFNVLAGNFDEEKFWQVRDRLVSGRRNIAKCYYHWWYQRTLNSFNAFIPLSAVFDTHPVLPHGISGIHISGGAHIGRDCVLFHHVTIGSNTLADSSNRGSPTIGDGCYIGCGASIIGNVRIGNNVRIGANCVVVSDIPDNSTVVMQKARIIPGAMPHNNEFIPR